MDTGVTAEVVCSSHRLVASLPDIAAMQAANRVIRSSLDGTGAGGSAHDVMYKCDLRRTSTKVKLAKRSTEGNVDRMSLVPMCHQCFFSCNKRRPSTLGVGEVYVEVAMVDEDACGLPDRMDGFGTNSPGGMRDQML